MADNMSNCAAEENVNISSDDFLNNLAKLQLDNKSITFEKGKLKWMRSFDCLKNFVETSLQLKGQWSSPGGHLKLFKETSGSAIIRYYTNSASILIQGDEGKKLENILLEKTAKNQRLSEDSVFANKDESIEDVSTNDLNSTITLQITTDSDLNDNQAFIENLSSASESSILAEALAKGTNFESNTAMTDNSSQINGDEVNGVQVINTSPVHSCSCQKFATELVSLKYKMSNLQTSIFSFETTLKDHDTILSLYNRSSDLNEKYLREISKSKQHIINLEQKLVKLEEERDTLQLAARLIAQDKYCRNSDSNSLRWQNVSKSNTTDRDITNNSGYICRILQTSMCVIDIYIYESLIDEGDYNGSNEPGNNHDTFQIHNTQTLHSMRNQSHLNNISEQSLEEHNNEPRHPQEDDQRQNTNKQQSGQAKSRMHKQQSRQDNPSVESADHNSIYSGAQSLEQCVV
ncbi:Hypothetical predicted protein [Paramuricea clavata]|uniref:Uncharacterized protein n=1 Tax=Paramuricea clavata TaxID=317549 RepID=A0A7D9DI19_PARCT|nr:Hypothetical predicted protein [Paramuricea clavata]